MRASELIVTFSVEYGSVTVASRATSVPPMSIGSRYEGQLHVYQLDFQNEAVVFTDLDISGYDVEQEMGAAPRILASVTRHSEHITETLGQAEIPAYLY